MFKISLHCSSSKNALRFKTAQNCRIHVHLIEANASLFQIIAPLIIVLNNAQKLKIQEIDVYIQKQLNA